MEERTPDEALAQHGMGNVRRDAEVIADPCPECGGRVVCAYDDKGLVDYDEQWLHVCLNRACDHFLGLVDYNTSIGGRSTPAITDGRCPWCRRDLRISW